MKHHYRKVTLCKFSRFGVLSGVHTTQRDKIWWTYTAILNAVLPLTCGGHISFYRSLHPPRFIEDIGRRICEPKRRHLRPNGCLPFLILQNACYGWMFVEKHIIIRWKVVKSKTGDIGLISRQASPMSSGPSGQTCRPQSKEGARWSGRRLNSVCSSSQQKLHRLANDFNQPIVERRVFNSFFFWT